jgi:predicted SAM-dependent methyltransferase
MKLHLGCGEIILPGWTNVDAVHRPGVTVADLSRTFPWETSSVDFIYNEHFLEHLSLDQGHVFLSECRRVLKPTGVLRISTPSLQVLLDDYANRNLHRIDRSVWAPLSPARMLNEAMRLWGHQFIYDEEELVEALRRARFERMARCDYGCSGVRELEGIDQRPNCGEAMFYEAAAKNWPEGWSPR